MLSFAFSVFCLPFFIESLKGVLYEMKPKVLTQSDIYVWSAGENGLWMSMKDDFRYSFSKAAFPTNDWTTPKVSESLIPLNKPASFVISTNSINLEYEANKKSHFLWSGLNSSAVIPKSAYSWFLFRQQDQMLQMTTRLNTSAENKSKALIEWSSTWSLNLSGHTDTGLSAKCFDIRKFNSNKMYLLVCKYQVDSSPKYRLVFFYFDIPSNTTIAVANKTSPYDSPSNEVYGIYWNSYAKFEDNACQNIESVLFILDYTKSGTQTIYTQHLWVILYSETEKKLLVGEKISFTQWGNNGAPSFLSQNSTLITGAFNTFNFDRFFTKPCENLFFIVAQNIGKQANPQLCQLLLVGSNSAILSMDKFYKDAASSTTGWSLTPNYTSPAFKCSGYSMANSTKGIKKLWVTPIHWVHPNLHFFLRARVEGEAQNIDMIIYDVIKIDTKTLDTAQSSFTSTYREIAKILIDPERLTTDFQDLRFGHGLVENFSTRIAYVCWNPFTAISSNIPNITNPTKFYSNNYSTDCTAVDIIEFILDTNSTEEQFKNESQTRYAKREYGPFKSVAFDIETLNMTANLMFAYKSYSDDPDEKISGKMMTVYDPKLFNYSVKIENYDATFYAKPIIGSNRSLDVVFYEIEKKEYFCENSFTQTMPIPFWQTSTTLLDFMSDKFHSPSSAFEFRRTGEANDKQTQGFSTKVLRIPYLETKPNSDMIIVDEFLIEISTAAPVNTIKVSRVLTKLKDYNTTANPFVQDMGAEFEVLPVLNTVTTSEAIYQFQYLKKAVMNSYGKIVLYFQKDLTYVALAFETYSKRFSFMNKPAGYSSNFRIFETFSKVFCVALKVSQNQEWSLVYHVEANKSISSLSPDGPSLQVVTLPKALQFTAVDAIDVSSIPLTSSLIFHLVGSFRAEGKKQFVGVKLILEDPLVPSQTAKVDYVKLVDPIQVMGENYIFNLTSDENQCVYRDVFAFVYKLSANNSLVFVAYNITKGSYFTDLVDRQSTSPNFSLTCADDFVVLNYDTKSVIVYSLFNMTKAYTRIRSIYDNIGTAEVKWVTSSPKKILIYFSGLRYVEIAKKTFKFYGIYKNPKSALSDQVNEDPFKHLKSTMDKLYFSWAQSKATFEFQAVQLQRKLPTDNQPMYIGNESIESQKKIIYDDTVTLTYTIDDYFRIRAPVFDMKLKSKLGGNLTLTDRVRHVTTFSKFYIKDTSANSGKVCNFQTFSSYISTVDQYMLRYLPYEDKGCFELSILKFNNAADPKAANGKIEQSKLFYLYEFSGVVTNCHLLRDESVHRTENRQAEIIQVCNFNFNNSQVLGFFRLNFSDPETSPILDMQRSLIIGISVSFTQFKAIYAAGTIYFAVFNEEVKMLYYSTKNYTFSSSSQSINTNGWEYKRLPATSFDLAYRFNFKDRVNLHLGINMLVSIFVPGESTYNLTNFALSQNGEMSVINRVDTTGGPKSALQGPIHELSCAYESDPSFPNADNFMICAYLYVNSRNVFYIKNSPFRAVTWKTENYTTPFYDMEIRQLKTVFRNREFAYIVLAYSPLIDRKYLIIYMHNNQKASNLSELRPSSDYLSQEVILYDSVDITETMIDLDTTDINYFIIGNEHFIGLEDRGNYWVYKFYKTQITIEKDMPFKEIESSEIQFFNHKQELLYSITLGVFFREKMKATFTWLYVSLIALGLAGLLVGLYLIFKKKNLALEEEINTNGVDREGFETEII